MLKHRRVSSSRRAITALAVNHSSSLVQKLIGSHAASVVKTVPALNGTEFTENISTLFVEFVDPS